MQTVLMAAKSVLSHNNKMLLIIARNFRSFLCLGASYVWCRTRWELIRVTHSHSLLEGVHDCFLRVNRNVEWIITSKAFGGATHQITAVFRRVHTRGKLSLQLDQFNYSITQNPRIFFFRARVKGNGRKSQIVEAQFPLNSSIQQ